jgi:3-hydroxymyristoyl/3-hydroxydecanoyl-(acyl carrier protein) dehydratase
MNFRTSIAAALVSGPEMIPPDGARFVFQFAANDPTFQGHFPMRPVLPGVYQLELTRFATERALARTFAVREIIKAKFLRPIIPEETIRLELNWTPKDGTMAVRARFIVSGQTAGEVLMVLE